MAMRGPRLQVGSAAWVAEERSCALQIAQSEVEEFSFSARNELDWLNEHMAGIFDENETNIAETFKTPGKLRGKTPRTARKPIGSAARVPLGDVFTATPNGSTNRFTQQLNSIQSPKQQTHLAPFSPSPTRAVARTTNPVSSKSAAPGGASQDSGYFGSQDIYSQTAHVRDDDFPASQQTIPEETAETSPLRSASPVPVYESPEPPAHISKEEEQMQVSGDAAAEAAGPRPVDEVPSDHDARDDLGDDAPSSDPKQSSPLNRDPSKAIAFSDIYDHDNSPTQQSIAASDDGRSGSDEPSPVRPVVRKSSLNFASLPAREPLGAGTRTSRPSQLDNRQSYYGRHTGGKSLGNHNRREASDTEDEDPMDVDSTEKPQPQEEKVNTALNHNRTYTQRLQDQINMLGQSKPNASRPSKSIHNLVAFQQNTAPAQTLEAPKSPTPKPFEAPKTTPGAFPEDDDDWIDPPPPSVPETTQSSRPALSKSHTADVMEGIHKSDRIGDIDYDTVSGGSPVARGLPSHGIGHAKSSSVPAAPRYMEGQMHTLTKAVSVSNPSMPALPEAGEAQTPSKASIRSFRESPLKQVKNKLSSILKSSKGLLASSAALSAEGKTSLLSPSTARLALHAAPSVESIASKAPAAIEKDDDKTVPIARRTRASNEREKEEKRRDKDARRMEEQMAKLDKAREKEREKARVFSKEQERIAAMERQLTAKKDEEKLSLKETPKATRSSPRKMPMKPTDNEVEMTDAPAIPPPSAPRTAAPSQIARGKDIKRPLKPAKEVPVKARQAPTVIKVNMGSQHSQYHASGSGSIAIPETPAAAVPQPPSTSKASKATLQTKTSTQSLRAASAAGKSKAAEMAARKKEQEEKEAQRRRDAKAELERKRAAAQEEQRKQDQRRQEAERQKQKDREQAVAHAEAKQNAQRQARIEMAKQMRAPPPAARTQPNGPPDFADLVYDEPNRLVQPKTNASKAGVKRAVGHDSQVDAQAKRAPSRGGPSYQMADAKRRRTGEDEEFEPPNIKGPPVRPSAGFKKELPKKSLFQAGYPNAQPSGTRDLFKATVTAQHNSHVKPSHPLDMAQISKGAIPFAPNANPPAASYKTPARPPTASVAKSTVKTAHKSSPRFQNGESIELPEIQTDDEDDSEDDNQGIVPDWVNSPELRRALIEQETMDPMQIFGPPRPLNMEEVFSKNKERWHKFRARTSSANWSGADRLTEEEIRRDAIARDRMRRDGGWSYALSKDLAGS